MHARITLATGQTVHEVASQPTNPTPVPVFRQRHGRFISGCIDSLSIE